MNMKLITKIIVLFVLCIVVLQIALVVFFPLLFLGRVKKTSDIYGVYTADHKYAKETLTLNSNGTFNQEIIVKETSQTNNAMGKWEYDSDDSQLIFDQHIMSILDEYGQVKKDYVQSKQQGLTIWPINKRFGCVVIDASEYISYKKKNKR